MTGQELLDRYGDTLTWCDENSNPAPDESAGYIRPMTAAEKKRAAATAEINEALSSSPDFERCTSDGSPDPNGDYWKLREPVT